MANLVCAVNVAGCLEINPSKSLYGAISRILNGPGTKSRLFEVPETFLARLNGTSHQASAIFRAKKVVIRCTIQPHLQHTDTAIFMSPVFNSF